MKELENNAYFWQKVDTAYLSGDYKTIYKKGDKHPVYQNLIFPCDYGHVDNGGEDNSMRIFKGSDGSKVKAVVVCANILKKELTSIVLVGLNDKEEEDVLKFLNSNEFQKTIIVRRGKDIPSWSVTE